MTALIRHGTLCLFLGVAGTAAGQSSLPLKRTPTPTHAAITSEDLMSRLYRYADDSMMGREAGTEWNIKATAYIAAEVQRFGLQPAGDNGTFFQNIPLVSRAVAAGATLTANGQSLKLSDDFLPRDQGPASLVLDALPVVYAGTWGDSTMLSPDQAAGKVVVIAAPRTPLPGAFGRLVPRGASTTKYAGAAAITVVSLQDLSPAFRTALLAPSVTMKDESSPAAAEPAFVYISPAVARSLFGTALDSVAVGAAGKALQGTLSFTESPAPGRNVVAILPGSDAALRGEFVAIGAHNDHLGFRNGGLDHDSVHAFYTELHRLQLASPNGRVTPQQRAAIAVNVDSLHKIRPARLDSIYNGADDDGSGTVTVLEIAEQLAAARQKPKRSVLFVWHTAEELGLYGSEYFTDHPTVARDSIVAQLNMDMVGRGRAGEEPLGGPRYIQLIGSHRLSTELGDLVETVNKTEPQPFAIDYQYDASGHPEQYYCRSDHYEYARYGIPIVFFSTGGHQDYHQVTDEPQYIDYDHMARIGKWVADVAMTVGNLDHRVVVDKPKPDPKGRCVQ